MDYMHYTQAKKSQVLVPIPETGAKAKYGK
jgi:hypothetical protein